MNERQTRMETQIFPGLGLKPLGSQFRGGRGGTWAGEPGLRLQSLGGLKAPLTQQLALLEAGHGWAGLAGRGGEWFSAELLLCCDCSWMSITLGELSAQFYF